jgi:hypothetical protein
MRFSLRFVIVLLFSFALTPSTWAEAQTTGTLRTWNQLDADEGKVQPQIHILTNTPLKGKVGLQTWTLTSKEWSEALVGLTFAPAKWASIATSLGLETDANPLRGGLDLWIGNEDYSLLFLQEYGGSGYWYRVIGTKALSSKLKIGVNGSRFFGWGPYVERTFGPASVWITAPFLGLGRDEVAFGLTVGFK